MAFIINRPYIEKIGSGKVRLCSRIEGSINDVLYYEVDEKYEKYLCDDRADAFVLGLLHSAMYNGEDIICNCGVSERLLFQVKMYYIPIVSKNMKDLHLVDLVAQSLPMLEGSAGAVGTGLSGGVDSFYTIARYNDPELGSNRLTHLLFNNIFTADVDESRIRAQHAKDVEEKRQIAREIGLEYIDMYTNLYAFYRHPGVFVHYFAMQYASAVMALGKLFKVFYFSSSYSLEKFSLDYKKVPSSGPFDLFSLKSATTDTLAFYSAGTEVTRYEKMQYFVDNAVAQRHLQVCGYNQDYGGHERKLETLNCGSCMKCSRAIVTLMLLGAFEKYAHLFDLSRYKKGVSRFVGRELAGDKGAFVADVLFALKNQNKLTPAVRIWRFIYSVKFWLSKSKFLQQAYAAIRKY